MFNTAQLKRIEAHLIHVQKLIRELPEWKEFKVEKMNKAMETIAAPKKRGRPSKKVCGECSFKGKNRRSLGAHRRFNHKAV